MEVNHLDLNICAKLCNLFLNLSEMNLPEFERTETQAKTIISYLSERVSEWVSEWTNEWASKWASDISDSDICYSLIMSITRLLDLIATKRISFSFSG